MSIEQAVLTLRSAIHTQATGRKGIRERKEADREVRFKLVQQSQLELGWHKRDTRHESERETDIQSDRHRVAAESAATLNAERALVAKSINGNRFKKYIHNERRATQVLK